MKVVCVDNVGLEKYLTMNKVYNVIDYCKDYHIYECIREIDDCDDDFYCIKDDENNEIDYFKTRFKPYNPIDKLKALINS